MVMCGVSRFYKCARDIFQITPLTVAWLNSRLFYFMPRKRLNIKSPF